MSPRNSAVSTSSSIAPALAAGAPVDDAKAVCGRAFGHGSTPPSTHGVIAAIRGPVIAVLMGDGGAGGRIVPRVGSMPADRASFPGLLDVVAAKTRRCGGWGYSHQGMARDLGPRGITVNVVQPGSIEHRHEPEGWRRIRRDPAQATCFCSASAARTEVAAGVVFLASPRGASVHRHRPQRRRRLRRLIVNRNIRQGDHSHDRTQALCKSRAAVITAGQGQASLLVRFNFYDPDNMSHGAHCGLERRRDRAQFWLSRSSPRQRWKSSRHVRRTPITHQDSPSAQGLAPAERRVG